MVLYVFAKTANQQYKVYVAGEYEVRYKRFTALVIVAVLTYVAATAVALAQLLRLLVIFGGRRRRD